MIEDINMKKYLIAILALLTIFNITGCGGSSSSSNATGPITQEMAEVRVNLTKSGTSVSEASVILYTESAALQAGLFENGSKNSSLRASVSKLEGSYNPVSSDENGVYLFKVPTGDYVLEAKTSDGSFMTTKSIRAAAGGSNTNAELTVTGTISGKVVFETKEPAKNAMVYLEKTSIVGITDKEGNFLLNNVPAGNTYNIVALINDFSNLVTPSQSVGVTESNLNVTLPDSLVIYENQVSTSITGAVKSQTPGESLSGFTVIAASPDSFTIGATNDNGEFALPISKTGIYNVMLVGSERTILPLSQSITVSKIEKGASNKLASDFVIGAQTGFGSVNGSVTLISEPGSNIDDLNIGKFLVRLIDSEGRYCYETTADYNIKEETGKYAFCFDNVAQGQYTVLVDPAGNGFFGYQEGIKVENQAATESLVEVTYLVPNFIPEYKIDDDTKLPCLWLNEVANFATPENFTDLITVSIRPVNASPDTTVKWTYDKSKSISEVYFGGSYCYYGTLTGIENCSQLEIALSKKWSCPCNGSEITGNISYINRVFVNDEQRHYIVSSSYLDVEALNMDADAFSFIVREESKVNLYNFSKELKKVKTIEDTEETIFDSYFKCDENYMLACTESSGYILVEENNNKNISIPGGCVYSSGNTVSADILTSKQYLTIGYDNLNQDSINPLVGIYSFADTTTPVKEIQNCEYARFGKDIINNKNYLLTIVKSGNTYEVQIYDSDKGFNEPEYKGYTYESQYGLPNKFQIVNNDFYISGENFILKYNQEIQIFDTLPSDNKKLIGVDNHGYYWWLSNMNKLCKGISINAQPIFQKDLPTSMEEDKSYSFLPIGINPTNNKLSMFEISEFDGTSDLVLQEINLEALQ